jgi:hypothetical protein
MVRTTFLPLTLVIFTVTVMGPADLMPSMKRAWPCCDVTTLLSRSAVSLGGPAYAGVVVVVVAPVVAGVEPLVVVPCDC